MMRVFLIIGVICIALGGKATASQVGYAPLADVAKETRWIIKAKVLDVTRANSLKSSQTKHASQVEYTLEPSAVLMGEVEPPQKVTARYTEVMPVIRNEQGEIVGTVSLIYSGSGEEFSVKKDEEWIFLFSMEGVPEDGVVKVLRAEPLSKIDDVMMSVSQ